MRTGVDLEEALMVLVPEAYRNHPDLMKHYPEVRRFHFRLAHRHGRSSILPKAPRPMKHFRSVQMQGSPNGTRQAQQQTAA